MKKGILVFLFIVVLLIGCERSIPTNGSSSPAENATPVVSRISTVPIEWTSFKVGNELVYRFFDDEKKMLCYLSVGDGLFCEQRRWSE